MNTNPEPSPSRSNVKFFLAAVLSALVAAGALALLMNIFERKQEAKHTSFRVVEIADDGKGFDVRETMRYPREGHVGLAVLADTCRRAGARLEVASAPGSGTVWRLTLTPEAGR